MAGKVLFSRWGCPNGRAYCKYIFFFVSDVILLGCPAVFTYVALSNPMHLILWNTRKTYSQYPADFSEYLQGLSFLAIIVGFAVPIYLGTRFLFSWLPVSQGERLGRALRGKDRVDLRTTSLSAAGFTHHQHLGSSNISPPVGSARDDITLSAQAAVQPLGTPEGYLRSTSLTGLVGSVRELACLQPPRGPRSGVAAVPP